MYDYSRIGTIDKEEGSRMSLIEARADTSCVGPARPKIMVSKENKAMSKMLAS